MGPASETAECDKGVCPGQEPQEPPKQDNPPAGNMPNEQAAVAQIPGQDARNAAGETVRELEGQAVEQTQ